MIRIKLGVIWHQINYFCVFKLNEPFQHTFEIIIHIFTCVTRFQQYVLYGTIYAQKQQKLV